VLDAAQSEVAELVWVGSTYGIVFARTVRGSLWRSGDAGASWSNETPELVGVGADGIYAIRYNADSPSLNVLFLGRFSLQHNATLIWATSTGGMSYRQPCAAAPSDPACVASPGGRGAQVTVSVKPHPRQADTLALLTRSAACPQPMAGCVRQELWVSTDFGHSWAALRSNAAALAGFIDYDWAPQASGSAPLALLATGYLSEGDREAGIYFSGYWDKRVHLVRSDDLFASRTLLRRCGNMFQTMGDGALYLGVAAGCDSASAPGGSPEGWSVTLETSRNGGSDWAASCFPLSEKEHGYTLYGVNGSDVYINVDHQDDRDPVKAGQPLGVVYHADAGGRLFTLSQRDVLLQPSGVSDLIVVQGMPGALLGNRVDAGLWQDPAFRRGTRSAYDAVQSRVSSDAGANWRALGAPSPLAGQAGCAGDALSCALHLHGPDAMYREGDIFAGAYSTPAVPGLVLSTGSVGRFLSYAPTEVNTYLSLDGAQSWATVAAGAHTYEVGASGGLLVFAATGAATDVVLFSLDGGACWNRVFLSRALSVNNIQIRPDSAGLVFHLHGLLPGSARQGAIFTLNFGQLLAPADFPACNPADYEAWAPALCQRGQAAIYTRRKPRARCQPAPTSRTANRACGCDPLTDFECSFGYERDASGACALMTDFALDPGCPAAAASPTRLLAGDVCATRAPPSSPRTRKARHGPSGIAIFFIVVFVLAAVAAIALVVARYLGLPLPPALRDGVDDAVASVRAGVNKLRGGKQGHTPIGDDWLDGDASFAPLAGSYVPPRL
jgi:hypothetical protein